MNSGRTKYSFTPTYGMQKRGFGKRQTERSNAPDLDFMQKPAPDFEAQISGVPDPYQMPQGIYHDPVPQSAAAPYQGYSAPVIGMGGNFGYPPQAGAAQGSYPAFATGYGSQYGEMNQAFTGAPLPQMPPLANAGSMQPVNASPRAQGYVPPSLMRAEQAAPSPMAQPNALQPSLAFPGQNVPYFSANYTAQQPLNPAGSSYPNYSGGGQPPAQPPSRQSKPPMNADNWLKTLLYIILPVAFVLCIALPAEFDILRYLFMTVCAASVGMLWYRQSFSPSLRTGITIGYGLMCVIVIVIMLSGSSSDVIQNNPNITPQPTPVITDEPSASALGLNPDQAPATTPPAQTAPADTDAGMRLTAFMDNWKVNSIENMLGYVIPAWRAAQSDPAAALFIIISNRTPLEYEIEEISGTSNDTSRSLTMSATIDKNNGNDPVRYRFVILMGKEDGDWYVDPNSLSTNDVAQTEATVAPDNLEAIFTLAPRMTVTPVPPDSTLLYYNASGGKYYHADPDCSAVNAKYKPLASFTYGEINDSSYSSLQPCLKCNAPTRPK